MEPECRLRRRVVVGGHGARDARELMEVDLHRLGVAHRFVEEARPSVRCPAQGAERLADSGEE
eukprot:13202461-Alexandrium_andersonii.AAC.1